MPITKYTKHKSVEFDVHKVLYPLSMSTGYRIKHDPNYDKYSSFLSGLIQKIPMV